MNTREKGKRKVRKAVNNILPEHLECRDLQHSWRPYTVKRRGRVYIQTLQCSRCITQKTRKITDKGRVVGTPVYHYPPGYVVHGLGHMTAEERGEVRMRSMLHSTTNIPGE